jgi:hypothetical protein
VLVAKSPRGYGHYGRRQDELIVFAPVRAAEGG